MKKFSSMLSSSSRRAAAATTAAAYYALSTVSSRAGGGGGSSVAAFTQSNSHSILSNPVQRTMTSLVVRSKYANTHGRRSTNPSSSSIMPSTGPPLYMASWWQTLTGDGGAYDLQVDYDALDFPGPELAECAKKNEIPSHSPSKPNLELATFAGGCFWGIELAFQRVEGVEYTCVGYTQGKEPTPNYDQVCAGSTGHTEALCVYFDPDVVSYETLVDVFFQQIDPTIVNGQGNDRGTQYRTGIYYHSESQKTLAHAGLAKVQSSYKNKKIATECQKAMPFWPAEDYHQQYLVKGGRFGIPQSAEKNCQDEIRCYG